MTLKNLNEEENGKTFVFLVRHGEFDFPKVQHRYNPHWPLNENGRRQAKEVAKKISKIKEEIDVFYSSSMRRAEETARAIERAIGKKLVLSDKLWELGNILWTRKYYHPKYWRHWLRRRERMKEFDRILTENQGKTILIVGHGHLIKTILAKKKNLSLAEMKEYNDYKNCHISLMRFNGTKLEKVYFFNNQELSRRNE